MFALKGSKALEDPFANFIESKNTVLAGIEELQAKVA
jgi:hypothetical protein